MKIALIGPGYCEIPPKGHGAVEVVLDAYKRGLEDRGVEVTLFNTRDMRDVVNNINQNHYDFIHCHYDEHFPIIRHNTKKRLCATTHFGWIHQPSKWGGYYGHIHPHILKADYLLPLTNNIYNLYKDDMYSGPMEVLGNGVDSSSIQYVKNPSEGCICIGKVETRKKQSFLSNLCESEQIPIDFVGPLGDDKTIDGEYSTYLGEWDRETLFNKLSYYKALALLSDGEADPLVVKEAVAAGVSVVVSEEASFGIDLTQPGIYMVKNPTNYGRVIKEAIKDNKVHRESLRKYATTQLDWSVVLDKYLDIVKKWM